MRQIPLNVSESTRKLNPHLYGDPGQQNVPQEAVERKQANPARLRQSQKPPTKLEADWRAHQEALFPSTKFRAQAIRFRLANGAWYKPDLMAWMDGKMFCWETKGPKQMKNVARGILTIKFAASAWPEVLFVLVWRENGKWNQQNILS